MVDPLSPGPVITDDEVLAALQRLLTIRGQMGVLGVSDIVVPTVSLGQVGTTFLIAAPPAFRSTDIFSAGVQIAPAVNTIMADTLALAAGTYDVRVEITSEDELIDWVLEHRNSANSANIGAVSYLTKATDGGWFINPAFGYELGTNERLRLRLNDAGTVGQESLGTIWARRRT